MVCFFICLLFRSLGWQREKWWRFVSYQCSFNICLCLGIFWNMIVCFKCFVWNFPSLLVLTSISACLFFVLEAIFHYFVIPYRPQNMFKMHFQARVSRWWTFLLLGCILCSFGESKTFGPQFQPGVSYKGLSYKQRVTLE